MRRHLSTMIIEGKTWGSSEESELLEVDYDSEFEIWEIRVWSDYFDAFVTVNKTMLENNFPDALAELRAACEEHSEQQRIESEVRSYVEDRLLG